MRGPFGLIQHGLYYNNRVNGCLLNHNRPATPITRVWKTKSTKDISVGMFTLQCSSVSLWAIYGVFMNDLSIIAANSLVFVQAATMLLFKNKYK